MKIRYFHPAFIDSAQSLMNEFKDDKSNTLLILGFNAAMFFGYEYDDIVKGYDRVIIFNQENLVHCRDHYWFDKFMAHIGRADEVWDYTESNMAFLAGHGIEAKLHILKPYMNWDAYAPAEKDIDFLLYGSLSPRRMRVVEFLREKYNVVTVTGTDNKPDTSLMSGVYGSVLDDYILRSRVLLNIHASDDQLEQEHARMVKWIGAPCQIISERSIHNYLNVPEMDYWELFTL